MMNELRLKKWIEYTLLAGIYLSIIMVMIGGIAYLWNHSHDILEHTLASGTRYNFDIFSIWNWQHVFSALGLIELGMIVLVGAQVTRVALLLVYYILTRDYWYILFSAFILAVILFSLIRVKS